MRRVWKNSFLSTHLQPGAVKVKRKCSKHQDVGSLPLVQIDLGSMSVLRSQANSRTAGSVANDAADLPRKPKL